MIFHRGSRGNLLKFLCEPLTDIINTMFSQHKYPAVWKMAEVVPLPKMKTPQRIKDNHRISLLFHCGKVTEKFFMSSIGNKCYQTLAIVSQSVGVGTTDAIIYTLSTGLKCSMIEAFKQLRFCSRTLAKLLILCSLPSF